MLLFMRRFLIVMAVGLFALPMTIIGQNANVPVASNNIYFYSTSFSPGNIYNQGPVGKVLLNEVSDEVVIKKKEDATKEGIENLVKDRIPDAQLSWITDNVCTVIADSDAISTQKSGLLTESDIVSLRPAYIRKTYKDLMDLYPVKQVALYGFTDEVVVQQIYDNDDQEVDALIESLGFQFESAPRTPGSIRYHRIFVSKESDIIEVANNLYESGHFSNSAPIRNTIVRNLNTASLDMSAYDYYYNYNGNKTYLYKTPGRFVVKKDDNTDKSTIEYIINRYLPESSITWKTDEFCKIETKESLVDDAIKILRNENTVVCANRCYITKSDYERMLLNGTGYPSDMSYDEIITLKFKDDVSATTIDSLKRTYYINSIEEPVDYYFTWAIPKTIDYLTTCNNLYESGYLSWIEPNWVTGYDVIFWDTTASVVTRIETPVSTKTDESYYDLLGRHLESPSGLTIVVTHYSDGSIKTEKKLFR